MINAGDVHVAIAKVCPVLSVSLSGQSVTVKYAPEATAQQKSDAQAIIAGLDWANKRPRQLSAIATDIQNLTAADKTKLQLGIQAAFLQDHPKFARMLGISLDGDEVDQ